MFIGCKVIITSIGASGAVIANRPDEPMWTFITVSVSTNASHSGFQYSGRGSSDSPARRGFR